MRILHLAPLALILFVFACGEKNAAAFDPAGQEWEFSLSNPLPIVPNLLVPDDVPISGRLRRELLSPGDVLQVRGDTVLVESTLKTSFTGLPQAYLLFTDDYQPDSLSGFKLSQGVGTTLNVAFYKGDTLQGDWLFEAKKKRFEEIAYGELSGQTYRCAFPGEDTMQVHFGVSKNLMRFRDKGGENEYYVYEQQGFMEERSYVRRPNFRFSEGLPKAMRNVGSSHYFYFRNKGSFGKQLYLYGRDAQGGLVASYIYVENGRYERIDMPMVLQGPRMPTGTTEADFAERMSTGKVMIDDQYPRVDSAYVSYTYGEGHNPPLEYDELKEIEMSFEAGGEWLVISRDRLVSQRTKWKLSPDGHYLITFGKDGSPATHFPILAFTDEYIDLRMPFYVKTREPRGVKLESYAGIDAFIRVKVRTDATSR